MAGQKRRPLYSKIKQDIRHQIMNAELRPGDFLPTRSELAKQYSTTQSTVSRAIGELSQEGLISSTSGRRTSVMKPSGDAPTAIAVVWNLPDDVLTLGQEYYGTLMDGIRHACAQRKIDVVFRAGAVSSYAEIVSETRAKGLLILVPAYQDIAVLDRIRSQGVPIIAVPGTYDTGTIPSISSDQRGGIRQAVDYLAGLNHSEIAFVSLTTLVPDHFERLQGFLAAMAAHDLKIDARWVRLRPHAEPDGYAEEIAQWLQPGALPTAIVAADFLHGLAVMRRLREIGARVPEDVSVIHFDNPQASAHLHPATTCIAQDVTLMGELAVDSLIRQMRLEIVQQADLVATELIVRESTTRRG